MAIGMVAEIAVGITMGISSGALLDRVLALLREAKYPLDIPSITGEEIVEAMRRDKKVQRGTIRMVIPQCLGQVEIREIKDEGLLIESWKNLSDRLRSVDSAREEVSNKKPPGKAEAQ